MESYLYKFGQWNNHLIHIENLLKGIIIASGNDACIALAEGIAGTEEEFAILMTSKAKEIADHLGVNHKIISIENYSIYEKYL